LKTDQQNYVAKSLRFSSDEELGKELLNQSIYTKHPYGHPNEGTVPGNQSLTLQNVKDFYQHQFTRGNVVVGVAGNYSSELIQQIKKDFATLPAGNSEELKLPTPAKIEGLHVVMVEKKTASTAFSMGFPLPFTRSDEDFYPMMIMNSWLGQHRTSVSHLYQVMREARGLNYGDYSYIEHFAFGGRNFQPPPNYARHHQIFQIWIRPVPNAARHFALRQAMRELQMLIDHGMTKEQFDAQKSFLLNYIVSLAQSNSEQLGYALDDVFYKLPKPFLQQVKTKVEAATLEQVNSAIKKYLNSKNMIIAVVTEDADSFKKALVENTPSPMHYDSPKSQEIMEEDKQIMNYPLEIRPENVTIIPVDKIFE
jgi:zinc protease